MLNTKENTMINLKRLTKKELDRKESRELARLQKLFLACVEKRKNGGDQDTDIEERINKAMVAITIKYNMERFRRIK
jgi:hypothetical protein|tara:strand:- start:349 stop:579 length:231 start_codon:yes stop_codon:yes gene_type:complete